MQEVKQLLQFCFGLKTTDGNYISAAGVLKYSDAFPVHELLKRFKPFGKQAPGAENFIVIHVIFIIYLRQSAILCQE